MNSIKLNKQRLIECRKNLGITKQEAAKRINLSQPAYLRYETGERTPSIHVIQTMADVLGTSVAYLTNKTNSPAPTSYTIHFETEPELFQLIETYQHFDDSMRNRLMAYIRNFNFKKS